MVQAVQATLLSAAAATGPGAALGVLGYGVAAMTVSGTFVGTVQFEGREDGSDWFAVQAVPVNGGAPSITATAPGIYEIEAGALVAVRPNVTQWTSGTITVHGTASLAGEVVRSSAAATLPANAAQETGGNLAAILAKLPAGPALDATLAALSAKFAALGRQNGANSISIVGASDIGPVVIAGAPAAYRSAITAADVIANPGALTTSLVTGGSLAATPMNVKIVAGNIYGRTTATQGTARTPTGGTLAIRIAFAQVPGATFYDVALSTDADPKFVARITEAQRAAGCVITAQDTVTAGGTPGAVDVQVAGTGQQFLTTAAQSVAYVIPADVDCTGKQYVDFDITPSRTGDDVSLGCTVVPFFLNSRLNRYFAGDPKTMVFGGTSGAYNALPQTYRVEARGRHVALAFASIVGTGASFDVDATPS